MKIEKKHDILTEEAENVNKKPAEMADEGLKQVSGGGLITPDDPRVKRKEHPTYEERDSDE